MLLSLDPIGNDSRWCEPAVSPNTTRL
ncbi:hypothetical protein R2601_04123 [Salipiger bermudensis HTCC2601]|uniref:Uncharacterized protein n=1 Tax=Salipiger bermudensis (strain DSM 26914 / JCM 13377 / KCTC 12554 / HTCC2601) TaxID=314265 RepID=Q0FW21_SALBH|nr:hypothetical protein R2601_04123 [Salipiger bermudensis HTCC2601]